MANRRAPDLVRTPHELLRLLPLVQRVVEKHGGTLRVESGPDTPTVVTLRLPTDAGQLLLQRRGSRRLKR